MAGQAGTELGHSGLLEAVEVLQVLQEPGGKSFAASLLWASLVATEFLQKEIDGFSFEMRVSIGRGKS